MIITESRINLSSEHSLTIRSEERERLHVWRDGPPGAAPAEPGPPTGIGQAAPRPLLQLSHEAQALQPQKVVLKDPQPMEPAAELEVSLFKLLVERLTGRQIEVMDPAEMKREAQEGTAELVDPNHAPEASRGRQGWGMTYDYYASHYESEQTRFSASGVVHTADGKTITLNISLSMSREFFTEQRLSVRAGDALKDPLVINFAGQAAELTQRDFSFDIDADGRLDQIAFVGPGSGLLALDKNGDGKINDGRELFGALSGNGFEELAEYDEDGNGWIDAGDKIYERLRVWHRDGQGQSELMALGQVGVGAIYLGNIQTPFQLTSDSQELLGQVNSSGLFLDEDGGVGSLQQLDLVV